MIFQSQNGSSRRLGSQDIKLSTFDSTFFAKVCLSSLKVLEVKEDRSYLAVKAQEDIFQRLGRVNPALQEMMDGAKGRLPPPESPILQPQSSFGTLIVPTPSAASTALHNILSETTGLYVPWKHDVDSAVSKEDISILYPHADRARESARRLVIVQHGYIAGTVEKPDAPSLLKQLCDTNLFIHSVRDPVQCFLSSANNELIQFIGAGSFESVLQNSCFGSQPISLHDVDPNQVIKVEWHIPKSDWLESSLNHASRVVRHFRVGSHYAQTFKEWIPIDVCTPDRESIARDVETLSRRVGVKVRAESFWSTTHATRMVAMLGKNKIRFNLDGFITPPIGLGIAGQAVYNNIFQEAEIAWVSPEVSIDTFPNVKPLCITVDASAYLSMETADRDRLMHPDTLNSIVAPLIYLWTREAMQVMHLMDACRASLNDLKSHPIALEILLEDTECFCNQFPEYRDRWAGALKTMRELV